MMNSLHPLGWLVELMHGSGAIDEEGRRWLSGAAMGAWGMAAAATGGGAAGRAAGASRPPTTPVNRQGQTTQSKSQVKSNTTRAAASPPQVSITVQGFNKIETANGQRTLITPSGVRIKIPENFSLDNATARNWYVPHIHNIPNLIDKNASLKNRAMQAVQLRNFFRSTGRDIMSDKERAAELWKDKPNRTFEDLFKHYRSTSKTDEEAYIKVIEASQRSNPEVNETYGVKPPQGVKQ